MLGVGGVAPAVSLKAAGKPIYSFLQSHKPILPHYTQLLPVSNCRYLTEFRFFALSTGSARSGSLELEKEAKFKGGFDDVGGDADDLMIPFEDRLLEDQIAQRKNDKPKIKLIRDNIKASEVVSSEFRVRINYLPKKKNVHKDLNLAFEGVQGIINISPVVIGNKKTRDPVCKGYGFVDFMSLQDANRFIQMFSGQSVAFGKIQKEIVCEIIKSDDGASKAPVQHEPSSSSEWKLAPLEVELDQNTNVKESDPSMILSKDDKFDDKDVVDKVSQLSIPVPAIRLKDQEKDELSDVFLRSEGKEVLSSKEIFMSSADEADQDPSSQFWEDDDFDEDEYEDDDEDAVENIDIVSKQEDDGGNELNVMPSPSSLSIHNKNMTLKADAEKSEVTETPNIVPKINIHTLAKMLKIRDTAKLIEFITRSRASKDRLDRADNIEEDLLQFIGEEGFEDDDEGIKFLSTSKHGKKYDNDTKPKTKAKLDSPSLLEKIEKAKAAKTKPVKKKANKTPKLKSPGSAKRLKGQDKAKLEDVFTKPKAKKALATKDM